LFSALAIAAFFALLRFVFLYEDDYIYGQAYILRDWESFLTFHVNHYLHSNGRAIIHLFLTVILAFDVHLLRIILPLITFLTIYCAAKCAQSPRTEEPKDSRFLPILVTVTALFLCLHVYVMRETVLWAAGALNYVYPMLLFFLAYYLLDTGLASGKKRYYLPLVTFFATATMEQIGPMAFGALTVCLIGHRIQKTKITWPYLFAWVTALGGLLTVTLAPGILWRVGHEGRAPSLESIGHTFQFFMTSPATRLFILLFTTAVIALLVRLFVKRDAPNRLRKAVDFAVFVGLVAFLAVYIPLLTGRMDWSFHPLRMVVLTVGYTVLVSYVLISFFFSSKQIMPFAFFAAAAGGQALLAVTPAPALWYRTLFGSILCILVVTVRIWFVLAEQVKFQRKSHATMRTGVLAAALLLLGTAGIYNYTTILRGYIGNRDTHLHHAAAAADIRDHADELWQAGIPLEDFIRPLHDRRYAHGELTATTWFSTSFMRYHEIYGRIARTAQEQHRQHRLFVDGEQVMRPTPAAVADTPYVPLRLMDIDGALYFPLRETVAGINRTAPNTQLSLPDNPHAARTMYGEIYWPVDAIQSEFGLAFRIEPNDRGGYDVWISS